jgi:hypothetical protein
MIRVSMSSKSTNIFLFYKYIGKRQATKKPNYKKQREREGSFPLTREEERKEKEDKGMLPEKDLVAIQYGIEWARKFALLLIFLPSQYEVKGIASKDSKIMGEILQSKAEFGCLKA